MSYDKIELKPLAENKEWLTKIAKWRNRPEMSRCLRNSFTSTDKQIDWVRDSKARGDLYYFIVCDGDIAGYCGLDKIHRINSTAEVSCLIAKEYSRKGIGIRAINELLTIAFEKLRLNLVYGEVYECNPNKAFWYKTGFKYEASLRDRKFYDGVYYASEMFSMTRYEWSKF